MNRNYDEFRSRISVLFVIFLIIVAVYLWFVDLLLQQRVFGLLLSAEFTAFSLLIYVYRMENAEDLEKRWLFIGVIALIFLVLMSIVVSL